MKAKANPGVNDSKKKRSKNKNKKKTTTDSPYAPINQSSNAKVATKQNLEDDDLLLDSMILAAQKEAKDLKEADKGNKKSKQSKQGI